MAELNLGHVRGADGVGIPSGGDAGQVLRKSSAVDYDTQWSAFVQAPQPNLLHDWDWRTPVNQRGFAGGGVSNAYCIDRWIGNGTITPSAGNHIALASGSSMTQRMEILPAKLAGKEVTVSVEAGGSIQSAILTYPAVGGASVSAALASTAVEIGYVDAGSGSTVLLEGVASRYTPYFKVTATSAVNIARMKLEIGGTGTLVTDAPMDYAHALATCQRYYVEFGGNAYNRFGAGLYNTPTTFIATTALPVEMRIVPTFTAAGNFSVSGQPVGGGDLSNDGTTTKQLGISISTFTGKTAGMSALLYAANDASARIKLSADL